MHSVDLTRHVGLGAEAAQLLDFVEPNEGRSSEAAHDLQHFGLQPRDVSTEADTEVVHEEGSSCPEFGRTAIILDAPQLPQTACRRSLHEYHPLRVLVVVEAPVRRMEASRHVPIEQSEI